MNLLKSPEALPPRETRPRETKPQEPDSWPKWLRLLLVAALVLEAWIVWRLRAH